LYALSDLSFRLLTAAPFAQRPSTSPSEAPIQIAKIMLEKNFAALLSNALADVDMNFPSVQRLLNLILRPLEHLTRQSPRSVELHLSERVATALQHQLLRLK